MAGTIVTTDAIRNKKLRPEPIKRYLAIKDNVVIPINSMVGVLNGVVEPLDSEVTYDAVLFSLHRFDTTEVTGQSGEFYEGIEVQFDATDLSSVNPFETVYAESNVKLRPDNNGGTDKVQLTLTEKVSATSGFVRVGAAN